MPPIQSAKQVTEEVKVLKSTKIIENRISSDSEGLSGVPDHENFAERKMTDSSKSFSSSSGLANQSKFTNLMNSI
jgi:hypothetical protein